MKNLLIIFLTIILTLILFSSNFKAKWGMIDDHEYMLTLHQFPDRSAADILVKSFKEEINKFGVHQRVRPIYWLLRSFEIDLFKYNVNYYYVLRIIIFIIFFSILWYILSLYAGLPIGGLFSLLILNNVYWGDLFNRLGPGETYGILGLSLMSLAILKIYLLPQKNKFFYPLILLIGGLVSIGSKENMIVLISPVLLLTIYLIWKKQHNWSFYLSSFLLTSYTFLIVCSIILAMKHHGVDVYEREVTSSGLFLYFLKGIFRLKLVHIFCYLGGFLTFLSFFYAPCVKYKKSIRLLAMGELFLLILYASQYAFYNGNWPLRMRYDFPGLMSIPLSIFLFYHFLKYIISPIYAKKFVYLCALFLIVFLGGRNIKGKGLIQIYNYSVQNKKSTQEFTDQLTSLIKFAKKWPEREIVFISFEAWDFERVVSVRRFLQGYGVHNKCFLMLAPFHSKFLKKTPLITKIHENLKNISKHGGFEFLPLSSLSSSQDKIALYFTHDKSYYYKNDLLKASYFFHQ